MIKNVKYWATAGLIALVATTGTAVAQQTKPSETLDGIQVLQGKWVKVCGEKSPNQMCMTTIDAFMNVEGIKQPVWLATAGVQVIAETDTKSILFRVPLRVRLKEGMFIRIDEGNMNRVEYQFCDDAGCWVVLPANDQLISNFVKGKRAVLQFSDIRGKTHQVAITLAGFTKAYRGKPSKLLPNNPGIARAPARTTKKGDAPAN